MAKVKFNIWRSEGDSGSYREYVTEISEGMVVLDAVHHIQAESANDLAVRWNCKAGKCGSCSAEINGRPRLMCMTRMEDLPPGQAHSDSPHACLSGDQRPRHRCFGQLPHEEEVQEVQPQKTRRSRWYLAYGAR